MVPERRISNRVCFIIAIVLIGVLAVFLVMDNQEKKKESSKAEMKSLIYTKGEKAEMDRINAIFEGVTKSMESVPGIVCWGDGFGLKAGETETKFEIVLKQQIKEKLLNQLSFENIVEPKYSVILSKKRYQLQAPEVLNMGVVYETTNTMLGRNGAVPYMLAEAMTIPKDAQPVEVKLVSANGRNVQPLERSNKGMEEVEISGIRGVIYLEQGSGADGKLQYFFTRAEEGEEVTAEAGTQIVTSGSREGLNYLPVLFMGENGGFSDASNLIAQQRSVLKHQNENGDRYLIVGLVSGTSTQRAELENAMKKAYGDRYLNLREYMSTRGIEDANVLLGAEIEPTAEDTEMMAQGMAPSSLLSDETHLNDYGYELLGRLVYSRMEELGYFDEIKDAIAEAMQ